jgi:uncharacterized membrane protein
VFDTIIGLPVHPLVVHAVVVLLPLACLATAAVAAWPAWRRFAYPLVALDAAVLAATFVARQSGKNLEHRIEQFSTPPGLHDHARWGGRLLWLAAALFVGSLIIAFLHSRRSTGAISRVVGVLAVVGALATIGVTAYVGHTGATAVWKQTIESTSTP